MASTPVHEVVLLWSELWRAHCCCGWNSVRSSSRTSAERQGEIHVHDAVATFKARRADRDRAYAQRRKNRG